MLEDLNAIFGTDRVLVTETPISSLQATFKRSYYKLEKFRHRITASADALNDIVADLSR